MRFQILNLRDALEQGYTNEWWGPHDLDWVDEYQSCVVDTQKNTIVGVDGGEPEDQTLGRDWSWVADALNEVHEENGR